MSERVLLLRDGLLFQVEEGEKEKIDGLIKSKTIKSDIVEYGGNFGGKDKLDESNCNLYDGKLFNTIDEDNVHKIIMDNLNDDKNITPWKFKTKIM